MIQCRVHVCASSPALAGPKRRHPRAFAEPGDMVLVPTAANGQPAVAEYRRASDNVMRAHSIHVLTGDAAGIAAIVVFLDPTLFSAFGLSPTR